jgi:hypothetical protein
MQIAHIEDRNDGETERHSHPPKDIGQARGVFREQRVADLRQGQLRHLKEKQNRPEALRCECENDFV